MDKEKELLSEAQYNAFEFSTAYKPFETDLDYRLYAEYGYVKGYIAGANSKYVEQKILEAQIAQYKTIFEMLKGEIDWRISLRIRCRLWYLQEKLHKLTK